MSVLAYYYRPFRLGSNCSTGETVWEITDGKNHVIAQGKDWIILAHVCQLLMAIPHKGGIIEIDAIE